MDQKANVLDVRRVNRALLVRHLMDGETSRSEVGRATGLSPATVTTVISQLIDEGTVRAVGTVESDGGRPRTILGINGAAATIVGVDISDRDIAIGLFDLLLQRYAETTLPLPAGVTAEVVERTLIREVRALVERNDVDPARVLGLGLGVPGFVEHPGGDSVVHADVIGWHSATFHRLEAELGIPVLVDNGAKTTTQGEAWFGAAKGAEHAIVVLLGNGAGAGVITNGRLYRGSSSSAGEWGHTKISLEGPRCSCGAVGCIETFIAARHVLERWQSGNDWAGREAEGIDQLLSLAGDRDAAAVIAVENLLNTFAVGLSNLVNLYNPQRIVISGWFGDRLADRYLSELASRVKRLSLAQPGSEVRLEPSSLRRDAVLLGAAILPLERFVESGALPLTITTKGISQ